MTGQQLSVVAHGYRCPCSRGPDGTAVGRYDGVAVVAADDHESIASTRFCHRSGRHGPFTQPIPLHTGSMLPRWSPADPPVRRRGALAPGCRGAGDPLPAPARRGRRDHRRRGLPRARRRTRAGRRRAPRRGGGGRRHRHRRLHPQRRDGHPRAQGRSCRARAEIRAPRRSPLCRRERRLRPRRGPRRRWWHRLRLPPLGPALPRPQPRLGGGAAAHGRRARRGRRGRPVRRARGPGLGEIGFPPAFHGAGGHGPNRWSSAGPLPRRPRRDGRRRGCRDPRAHAAPGPSTTTTVPPPRS